MNLVILRTDGTVIVKPNVEQPSLKELQNLVDGYIERVPCTYKSKKEVMIINEEGRLKSLPVNMYASDYYNGVIVGDAVILQGGDLK